MRIDPSQAAAVAVAAQADAGENASRNIKNADTANATRVTNATEDVRSLAAAANAGPPKNPLDSALRKPGTSQLDVSVDDMRNVIYRFVDPDSGEVIRQVPPEEVLKIMRNIEEMLNQSDQKLDVAL